MNKNIYALLGASVIVAVVFFGIQSSQDSSSRIGIRDTAQILSSAYHESILPLFNGSYISSAYTALVSNASSTAKTTKAKKLFGTTGVGAAKIDGTAAKNRARRLKADPKVLTSADAVELNLFTDRTFVAKKARTLKSGRAEIWAGKIEGQEGSEVTLVTQDNQITGSIRTKEGEFYTITPDPKTGESQVKEVSKNMDVLSESQSDTVVLPADATTTATTNKTSLLSSFKNLMAQAIGAGGTEQTTIDLLVVYTPEARVEAGGTSAMEARIQLAVAEMNQAYINSKVDLTMRVVGMVEAAPSANQGINISYLGSVGENATVKNLQDQYSADLVAALVVPSSNDVGVGLASIATSAGGTGWSVSQARYITGPYYVLSHEIGHNLGAVHDRDASGSLAGAFPYSYGYFNPAPEASFKDIMSYAYNCACVRINNFSNPNVLYKGFPTGVPQTEYNSADIASTFQKMKGIIARNRGASLQPTKIINFFEATPTVVSPGQATVLSWSTNGPVNLNISGGVGSVTGVTSRVVYPTATTTYILTAVSNGVTETASVTVGLKNAGTAPITPPIINSFTASPLTITPYTPTTLTWSTTNATDVTISGVGNVTNLTSKSLMPLVTTTYTLTASNANSSKTASVTIVVNPTTPTPPVTPAPTISTFTASPTTITTGSSTTLSWSTTDATSVSISGIGAVTGTSKTVSPTTTTTYTLTATNASGSKTANVTVTVNPVLPTAKPIISSFSASPTSITAGAYSTLSWNVSGATSISVSTIGYVLATGQVSVSPQSTTSYILTATNSAGTVTSTVTVNATTPTTPTAAPNIAYPNSGYVDLRVGQSATVVPDNYGGAATSCYAEQTLPTGLSLSSTCVISGIPTMPQSSIRYSMLAYNNLGGRRTWVNISVSGTATPIPPVTPAPTISTFTASPTTITTGSSTTLSWSTTDATSVSISGIGAVTGTSKTVSPTTTTTYTLTATNASGSKTANVTVTVNPVVVTPPPVVTPAPTISSFAATPTTITAGSGTMLTWTTSDATSLSISGVGSVTGLTSKLVYPTANTTYTLTATNASGSKTGTVTVVVNPVVVTPPPVVTPPTSNVGITITSPTTGSSVSGVVYATAKVTGFTPSLDYIYLYVDNRNAVKAYYSGGGLYNGGVGLSGLTPGVHTLNFSSTDVVGKTYTATVNINVTQ